MRCLIQKNEEVKQYDLNDFFSFVNEEKKKNHQELESLISGSFDELFLKPLQEEKKIKKRRKNKKTRSSIEKEKRNEKGRFSWTVMGGGSDGG